MDDETLKELKWKYKEAKEREKDEFFFLEQPVLVVYAKYLIEYNENFRKDKKGK